MQYEKVHNLLKGFKVPNGYPIILLPEDVLRSIHGFIIENDVRECIELGTAFGATACVMAAAVQELGKGKVVTMDIQLTQPSVMALREHVGLPEDAIEVIVDKLGYNWYLADLIQKQTDNSGYCKPLFDFCLLDGSHEWTQDALAFLLIAKLLKPGGWIAFDDINFCFNMMPNVEQTQYAKYSDKERETFQLKMVYDLVVRPHPDFRDFKITDEGRIGWARKKYSVTGNLIKYLRIRK